MLSAALTLAILGGAYAIWRTKNPANGPIRSLVVLPFQTRSPDKGDEYLSDGLTDELTNVFAQWNDLRVVARTSSLAAGKRIDDIRGIGRDLRVAAVLTGLLRVSG